MKKPVNLRLHAWEATHPSSFRIHNTPVAIECCCGPVRKATDFRTTLRHNRQKGCEHCDVVHMREYPETVCCRWLQYNQDITSHARGFFVPGWLAEDLKKNQQELQNELEFHRIELLSLQLLEDGVLDFEKMDEFARAFLAKVFSGALGEFLPPHFNTATNMSRGPRIYPASRRILNFLPSVRQLQSQLCNVKKQDWYLQEPCRWARHLNTVLPKLQNADEHFTMQDVKGGQRTALFFCLDWLCLRDLLSIAGCDENDAVMRKVRGILADTLKVCDTDENTDRRRENWTEKQWLGEVAPGPYSKESERKWVEDAGVQDKGSEEHGINIFDRLRAMRGRNEKESDDQGSCRRLLGGDDRSSLDLILHGPPPPPARCVKCLQLVLNDATDDRNRCETCQNFSGWESQSENESSVEQLREETI